MNHAKLIHLGELAMITDALGRDSIAKFMIPHISSNDDFAKLLFVVLLLDENAWIDSFPIHNGFMRDPCISAIRMEDQSVVTFERCVMTPEGLVGKKLYDLTMAMLGHGLTLEPEWPDPAMAVLNDSIE